MSTTVLVYKTGRRVYHASSAFTHQRLGTGMRATWAKGFQIKKLIWLVAILSAILLLFLFPKVAAQTWFNNPKPTDNQNSADFSENKNPDPPAEITRSNPPKASGSTISKNQTQTPPPNLKPYTKDEVKALIISYSAQYGIDPAVPLRIANCESGYRWDAKNKTSTASGVFQYIRSTWANTPAGKQGISVFDADANVHMAIAAIANGGIYHWNASKHCWS